MCFRPRFHTQHIWLWVNNFYDPYSRISFDYFMKIELKKNFVCFFFSISNIQIKEIENFVEWEKHKFK